MGWASCFENNWQRHDEAAHMIGVATVGPTSTVEGAVPQVIAEGYCRLRAAHRGVERDIRQNCAEAKWTGVSSEMDALATEVAGFDKVTLLSSSAQAITAADSLIIRLYAIVARGKKIEAYLSSRLAPVEAELQLLLRRKSLTPDIAIPPENQELEAKCIWLINGWKGLRIEIRDLEDKCDELQIRLAGLVQVRLEANNAR